MLLTTLHQIMKKQLGGGTPAPEAPAGYASSYWEPFDGALNIIKPDNANGKYGTTRGSYMFLAAGQGPRAASSVLTLKMYDVDPAHTGHNDSNKGASVSSWSDAMVQSGGKLTLKARRASAPEQALYSGATTGTELGAMIHTAGAILATPPFSVEFKGAVFPNVTSPGGYHPSYWLMGIDPTGTYSRMEIDYEGESEHVQYNEFAHVSGVTTSYPGSTDTSVYDGQPHDLRLEVTSATRKWYVDGVLKRTVTRTLEYTDPMFALVTSHVADFPSDPYVSAEWTSAGSTGASISLDGLHFCRQAAASHYAPLVASTETNVDFNTAFEITLPSATALWGSSVTDNVVAFMQESFEPGGNYNGGYGLLPSGVTWDSGTRKISGTISDKAGTLHLMCYVTGQAGSTCQPYRLAVHVGPRWTQTAFNMQPSTSIDLYALADCGQLTSVNGARAKTITASIPGGSGLSLVGDSLTSSATLGTNNVDLTVTNSRGQSKTTTVSVTVASGSFVEDTFSGGTDVAITSHTGETGATWTPVNGVPITSVRVSTGGTAYMSSGGSSGFVQASGIPANANYRVDGVMDFKTLVSGEAGMGVAGRIQASGENFYFARYGETAGRFQLYKSVAGTTTLLAQGPVVARPSGTFTLSLVMNGSTISGEVDGVQFASATDTSHTTAGKAGLRAFTTVSSSTGQHISRITATAI